jgi:Holliday junction resolvase RusA-like endonuclease
MTVLEVIPFPKPRMNHKSLWTKTAKRYFTKADELREKANGLVLPPILTITFIIPMAKSWPIKKKKEYDGKPHQQRPDLSNLVKAVEDILCEEDSYIFRYDKVEKIWGYEGKIIIF